jgi:hypothetical protein
MDEIEAVLSRHLGRAPAPVELSAQRCIAATQSWRPGFKPGRCLSLWAQPGSARWWHRLQPVSAGLAGFASAAAALLLAAFYLQPATLLSSNAVEIRSWIQVRAGIDLPLRAEPPSVIRLTGARVGRQITEVTFEIGGRAGVLRVPAKATHQSYKLACATPEDERLACLLCHSGGAF